MPDTASARHPGLDGLRGIAILLVMAYHANLLAVGWIGVQLFFVLSGFLITRQLLGLRDTAHPWRTFWIRRALRILPAYGLYLLAAVLLGGLLLGVAPDWQQLPYAATFTYNLYRLAEPTDSSRLFDHLWSLAIEEQFYLLWPLLILGLANRRRDVLILGLLLVAPLLRLVTGALADDASTRAYLVGIAPSSHWDAFAWGAAAQIWGPRLWPRRGIRRLWLVICVLSIGLGMLLAGGGIAPSREFGAWLSLGYANGLPANGQFVWGYSLLNVMAAGLIAHLAYGRRHAGWLEQPWLRGCGRLSYSAYLWHFPLAHGLSFLVYRIHDLTGWGFYACLLAWFPLYCLCVLAVAAAAYWGVERPFNRGKDRWAPT